MVALMEMILAVKLAAFLAALLVAGLAVLKDAKKVASKDFLMAYFLVVERAPKMVAKKDAS